MVRLDSKERERGFSLLEALLALAITLVVMTLVAESMRRVARIYESQSELAASATAAGLAFDDIAREIADAGQGLGEGPPSILSRRAGLAPSAPSAETLTIRSNPALTAGALRGELAAGEAVALESAEGFEPDARVLVTDRTGSSEAATVIRAFPGALVLRSLETAEGDFRVPFSPGRGARVLGLREVSYYLEEARADGRRNLVKDVSGVGSRVLSGDVLDLFFEYFDSADEPISEAKLESAAPVSVRVRLRYLPRGFAAAPRVLATRVALEPASGSIDFEKRHVGLRWTRLFHPLHRPAGVAARIGADWAVILASGQDATRDAAYLYTFQMEEKFLSAAVDDVVFLEDVRAPVALTFGPEGGPLEGSLFVAAWGLRIGHLSRIAPDASGRLSRDSEVFTFEGTDAIAQAGGIGFGPDDALYVASREKGAIYRFRFGARGIPGKPERLFRLTGTPGEMAAGNDGHLYFVMNHLEQGSLWKIEFDETLSPRAPVLLGPLPGFALSVACDPVTGDLYTLVRDLSSDYVVFQLGGGFRKRVPGSDEPTAIFSLRRWRTGLTDAGLDPREVPFGLQELLQSPVLGVEELDSIGFDALGSLYMMNREANVVLKFDLERPSGRFEVGLAAGVIERGEGVAPAIAIHAWKKHGSGS